MLILASLLFKFVDEFNGIDDYSNTDDDDDIDECYGWIDENESIDDADIYCNFRVFMIQERNYASYLSIFCKFILMPSIYIIRYDMIFMCDHHKQTSNIISSSEFIAIIVN